MIKIDLSCDPSGVWTYADNEQSELAATVFALCGWQLASMDDWLNTDTHWSTHPEARRHLFEQRDHLMHTFRLAPNNNEVFTLEAEKLLMHARVASAHVLGLEFEQKGLRHSASQAKRRAGKGVLTESNKKSILREYEAAVVPYGKIKELARKYDVSTDTVSRLVNGKKTPAG